MATESSVAKTLSTRPGPDARAQSKADQAYETILQAIHDGEHEAGSRLVIERLARALGFSVLPVREALRRLEAAGYVTFKRNVGATVAEIDLDGYPESIETVATLEGVALGLAAPHLAASDLQQAHEINDRLRRLLADFDATQFTKLNREFHESLFNACPNRHLLSVLDHEWGLLEMTRRSAFSYIPARAERSVDEHDEILSMLEAGRPGIEIELFARGHRMETAYRLLQHLSDTLDDPAPLEAPRAHV